jgi:hypothetical protein
MWTGYQCTTRYPVQYSFMLTKSQGIARVLRAAITTGTDGCDAVESGSAGRTYCTVRSPEMKPLAYNSNLPGTMSMERSRAWSMTQCSLVSRVTHLCGACCCAFSIGNHVTQGILSKLPPTNVQDLRFVFVRSVRRLLVMANVVPSSPSLVTLTMEALSSSETSVLTRATQRNISEDGILHACKKVLLVLIK